MLYQLLYSSIANQPFDEPALLRLLAEARAFNDAHGITGAMLYFDKTDEFFQVLEGEMDEVHALMRRISRDPRHRQIAVAHEGPLAARSFSAWSMGFRLVSESEAAEHLGYAPTLQAGLWAAPVTGRKSVSMRLLDLMRENRTRPEPVRA